MLTLTDARNGRATPVAGRVLRLLVVPGADASTAERAFVVADVARRAVGLRGGRAVVASAATDAPPPARLLDLNVPPPEPADDMSAHAVVATASEPGVDARCVALVGPVAGAPDAGDGADPLAVRLAMLDAPYTDRIVLTREAVEAAADRLAAMRRLVAGWADRPSAAPPQLVVDRFLAAVDRDLDTRAALRALDEAAADTEISDGAKFELFAYADRVLALDLAREVGRSPA